MKKILKKIKKLLRRDAPKKKKEKSSGAMFWLPRHTSLASAGFLPSSFPNPSPPPTPRRTVAPPPTPRPAPSGRPTPLSCPSNHERHRHRRFRPVIPPTPSSCCCLHPVTVAGPAVGFRGTRPFFIQQLLESHRPSLVLGAHHLDPPPHG
jgi:hypothetical protein